jgi:hypothetical protein
MVGDRAKRVKRKLGRVRVYKRVGTLEEAVDTLKTDVGGLEQGARVLTDKEIREMRRSGPYSL